MYRFLLVGCVAVLILATIRPVAPAAEEAASHVMLTRGIVGGFVPAHVSLQIIALKTNTGFEVHVLDQPARNAPATYRRGSLTERQYADLFATAKKLGIWNLPREMPAGSEDIYKLDTSISLLQGMRSWRNGGPAGCVHGESKVQATVAQRAEFRDMIEAITELARKNATKPSDADAFQAARQLVEKQTPKAGQPGKVR